MIPKLFVFVMVIFMFDLQWTMADDLPFGRVFSTPAQRMQLDALRLQGEVENKVAEPLTTQQTAQPERLVILSGVVLRGDGKSMIWINGKSQLSDIPFDAQLKAKVLAASPELTKVEFKAAKKLLKPGQVWLLDKNRVAEAYEVNAVGLVDSTLETDNDHSEVNEDPSINIPVEFKMP